MEQSRGGIGRYPQSIVCFFHPGRPADTLLRAHGINMGEDWAENVCWECDAAIKAEANARTVAETGNTLMVLDLMDGLG